MTQESLIAVFVDFENVALGSRSAKSGFKIDLVLKRLLQKGRIVFKRAYCDWSRYRTSCLLYTSPSPRDLSTSRMPSSA